VDITKKGLTNVNLCPDDMNKKPKRKYKKKAWAKRRKPKPVPYYDLGTVKTCINLGKVRITRAALDGARECFGWNSVDIQDAIMKLRISHYHKTDAFKHDRMITLDIYKACGIKRENVYTHFYIDVETGILVINSFKEI